jgi:hypothetical protein
MRYKKGKHDDGADDSSPVTGSERSMGQTSGHRVCLPQGDSAFSQELQSGSSLHQT